MKNQNKNLFAVFMTGLIMMSIANYAIANNYDERGNDEIEQYNHSDIPTTHLADRYCITTGEGTGRIESYCADTEENLIEAIRADWSEKPEPKIDPQQKPRLSKYQRKASNPEIEALIRAEAERQGYDNPELAIDIADCESLLDPKNRNTRGNTPAGSVDQGLWMYNNHWQRKNITSECAYDAECSTRQAIKDLKAGKAHQWACYRVVR